MPCALGRSPADTILEFPAVMKTTNHVSEFGLPSSMQVLAIRIDRELYKPLRAAQPEAHERRTKSLAQVEELKLKITQAQQVVENHLNKQMVFPPKLKGDNHIGSTGTQTIESINKQLKEIYALSSKIEQSSPLPYWPGNNIFGWAFLIGIGLSIYYFHSVGLLWFPIVFSSRFLWVKRMQSVYQEFLKSFNTTTGNIESLISSIEERYKQDLNKIAERFSSLSEEIHHQVSDFLKNAGYAVAEWDDPSWENWNPDSSPEFAARLGTLKSNPPDLQALYPNLNLEFNLPILIPFTRPQCVMLNASTFFKKYASDALLSALVRILANTPPGKARFTFFDPLGLGQSAADFLHLGDLNKDLISGKVWSEPAHIEQQLVILTEHIETVIQSRLRNTYASILNYNAEHHEIAEPFRFLVINDFPAHFEASSTLRRLLSIIKNGPRCGVFTFIIRDQKKEISGELLQDLNDASMPITIHELEDKIQLGNDWGYGWALHELRLHESTDYTFELDKRPPQDTVNRIVKISGEQAIEAMKIDVPFQKLLSLASMERTVWWSESSANGLSIPLGPAGIRSTQELSLGGSQEAHALLVGRTGSGKTNLMHVIITALALKYLPQEVQLYLVDFKGGVGFKRYAEWQLPHAKVIAIESEREFGMSVLKSLDDELKQRSDLFRAASVDGLTAYREKMQQENPHQNPMPRIFLIVDEFQEFFTENDDVAQQAKVIFERLARQGRSYGIHFLLATQSLSGSAQLPAAILGQIKVRIALPCSETDSRLILADDNKAARALSLPGEAIYNPMGGLVEGNNRFQVARFSDDDLQEYLSLISENTRNHQRPIVFEGNELAVLSDCVSIKESLKTSGWPRDLKGADVFIGEPIAILPSVAAAFRRQSGKNLMILSREEEEGVGICISSIISILTQLPPESVRIYVADFCTADCKWTGYMDIIAEKFPQQITVINRQKEAVHMLASIFKDVERRGNATQNLESTFVFLQGLHRIKSLRDDTEDDETGETIADILKSILQNGPEVGVHVIAWADTWTNATRGLDRKAIGEFGLRVATAMDSGDSLNFLDNLAASKISKAHRAIFYNEDRPGQLTTFRPYAIPSVEWISEVGECIQKKSLKKEII